MNNTTFVLTDGTTNSYGFSINMSKLRLDRFKSNPVMLYNHDELIGKWENIRLEEGRLLADTEYIDGEEFSLKIKKRVENGFLKGASIGIYIFNETRGKNGKLTVDAEVFECSICDIPSNKNAVVLYDKEGTRLKGKSLELTLDSLNENLKELKIKNDGEMKLHRESYKALGLGHEANISEIETAIKKLADACTSLQLQLDKIYQERVKRLLDKAFHEGCFLSDKRQHFEKLAMLDFEMTKQIIDSMPGKKTLAGKEQPAEKFTDIRKVWTHRDWRKKDTAGLLAIKKADPEQYAEILKIIEN